MSDTTCYLSNAAFSSKVANRVANYGDPRHEEKNKKRTSPQDATARIEAFIKQDKANKACAVCGGYVTTVLVQQGGN